MEVAERDEFVHAWQFLRIVGGFGVVQVLDVLKGEVVLEQVVDGLFTCDRQGSVGAHVFQVFDWDVNFA